MNVYFKSVHLYLIATEHFSRECFMRFGHSGKHEHSMGAFSFILKLPCYESQRIIMIFGKIVVSFFSNSQKLAVGFYTRE